MIHARKDYDPIQDPRNKIAEDEPVILFRAKDKWFLFILWFYILILTITGGQKEMIESLKNHSTLSMDWQKKNKTKHPDMPVE